MVSIMTGSYKCFLTLIYSEEFCPKDIQKEYFDIQLKLASDVKLPLFLHCRAAHDDFLQMIKNAKQSYFQGKPFRGVVHSFDGTDEMVKCFTDMGLYIGVNGCSLKNQSNLEVRCQNMYHTELHLHTIAVYLHFISDGDQ